MFLSIIVLLEFPDYWNQGKNCGWGCGCRCGLNKQCNYCGKKGLCCKQGVAEGKCDGIVGGSDYECSEGYREELDLNMHSFI